MGLAERESRFALYKQRVASIDTLDAAAEAELARAWKKGNRRAGDRLIEGNLKHVISIAREYRRWGLPLDDLVQQGNIGLLKAAERFDPSQGTSLRTYAAYWVRAEIRDYVVRGYRIVRLGTTRTERRAMRAFRSTPIDTVEQLAEHSGMPLARCEKLWPLLKAGDRSLDQTRTTGATPPRESLSSDAPSPEDILAEREEAEARERIVGGALSTLSERERRIVRARMMTEEPATLEQLGKRIGVSRERVRQLESRAKEKMRDALVA